MSTAPDTSKAKADPKVDAKAKKSAAAKPAKEAKAKPAAAAEEATPKAAAAKKPAAKKAKVDKAAAPARSAHSESRLAQVLIAPIVSEKATMAAEKHNQVLFKVMRDATKPEIKAAVELMFKVTVDSVQTVQHKGKTKRFGKGSAGATTSRRPTCRSRPGQELNFSGEGA